MPMQEFRCTLTKGKVERHTVIITFDDGYYDNYKHALPILEYHQVPAAFYVASTNLDTQNEFWWDDLERILLTTQLLPSEFEIEIAGKRHHWETGQYATMDQFHVLDGGPLHPRQRMYMDLCRIFRQLEVDQQRQVLDKMTSWAGVEKTGRVTHRSMTSNELIKLSKSKFATIGGHTHHHCELSRLPGDEQQRDIERNKQQLEKIIGKKVDTFSYPFGSRVSYNEQSVAAVKSAGYLNACSNFPGVARRDVNMFELPRVLVRDWSADEFKQHMRRWFCE